MFTNCVTLAGPLFAIKEERHIVVHLIMQRLRFCKEKNMI